MAFRFEVVFLCLFKYLNLLDFFMLIRDCKKGVLVWPMHSMQLELLVFLEVESV